jgi:hypothetical protein
VNYGGPGSAAPANAVKVLEGRLDRLERENVELRERVARVERIALARHALEREGANPIATGAVMLGQIMAIRQALTGAVEASDADTDTPHRLESER